ncbi:MAG: glcB 2 [Microbacteriaceae bacterium]|nr:glcB 2 [Microbacteriaceae bacterium]
MSERVNAGELSVATELYTFVTDEALPGSGVEADAFWAGASAIVHDLAPRNRELLAKRDELQAKIDGYHRANPGQPDPVAYKQFLTSIGYLVEEPADFTITTSGVDTEITAQAGPQLVVPLLNARFSSNAANARWGSLYDALYGTDAISEDGELARGSGYNAARGAAVIAWGRKLLDDSTPLSSGSHVDATAYTVDDEGLAVALPGATVGRLADPSQFVGYAGSKDAPTSIVLVHNNLHIEIQVDPTHSIGATDAAGVKDIVLESALTSIMDLEDSVAAVDAEDKTLGYRNWLELNKGTLTEQVTKNGKTFTRTMNGDRDFTSPSGEPVALHGRALMFIRQVGHLMTTDAVLDRDGNEVPEGILDALMTTLGSVHDLRGDTTLANSRTGAMYVVKPKMHGPEEVAFTVEIFRRVEELLGLPPLSIKLGIMDEERRTTVNLKACIEVAKDRVVFINTGFLDRTGDEIHTSLLARAFVRKGELKAQRFIQAYENANVDTGLAAGFQHRAQVGKGMWAMPNLMAAMLEQKIAHPKAGATTAWVPSPTAATLHALHYHQVDVFAVEDEIKNRHHDGIDPILIVPLAPDTNWSDDDKKAEVDNNVQSILGYVVRWVDQGIGCSTVPDINNVGLMEDRATLRISSQLLANWVAQGIVTEADILESMNRIAPVVDEQNAGDALYEKLIGPNGPGLAFTAARDLILLGSSQPNGYTEPILHRVRREKKKALAA